MCWSFVVYLRTNRASAPLQVSEDRREHSRCWRRSFAPGKAHSTPACRDVRTAASLMQTNADVRQMTGGVRQGNEVLGRLRLRAGRAAAGNRGSSVGRSEAKKNSQNQQTGCATVREGGSRVGRHLMNAISVWPAASRRSRQIRRWTGSRPHRQAASSGAIASTMASALPKQSRRLSAGVQIGDDRRGIAAAHASGIASDLKTSASTI